MTKKSWKKLTTDKTTSGQSNAKREKNISLLNMYLVKTLSHKISGWNWGISYINGRNNDFLHRYLQSYKGLCAGCNPIEFSFLGPD